MAAGPSKKDSIFSATSDDTRKIVNPNAQIPVTGLPLDNGAGSDDGDALNRSIPDSEDYFSCEESSKTSPLVSEAVSSAAAAAADPIDDAAARAQAKADLQLLTRMLDLDRPIISASMVDFLIKDGVCASLGAFISRPNRSEADAWSVPFPADFAHRPRAWEIDDHMKRSYRAMGFLVSPTKILTKVLEVRLAALVLSLLRIFEPEANGNFHHFTVAMKLLLTGFPQESHALFAGDQGLVRALHFLHEPTVAQLIITALLHKTASPPVYEALASPRGLALLVRKLSGADSPADVAPACDFVHRLAAELHTEESSTVLWAAMARRESAVVDTLVDRMADAATAPDARLEYARLLTELLAASRRVMLLPPFDKPDQPPPPNLMSCMLHHLCLTLVPRVRTLAELLLAEPERESLRFGKYSVARTLSPLTLDLLRVIADLSETVPELVFPSLGGALWSGVIERSVAHPHNNILHDLLRRLFVAAVGCPAVRDDALRVLLVDARMVDVFVGHYMSDIASGRTSGFVGHILALCNVLRLRGDSCPPGSFLVSFLETSEKWQAFLPVLRDQTAQQASWPYDGPRLSGAYPMPGAAALPANADLADTGIDLGSNFAHGFNAYTERKA